MTVKVPYRKLTEQDTHLHVEVHTANNREQIYLCDSYDHDENVDKNGCSNFNCPKHRPSFDSCDAAHRARPMIDDARAALVKRLERIWAKLPLNAKGSLMMAGDGLDEIIVALRTPAPDLRAWVQHLPTCAKSSTRLITRFGAIEFAGQSAVCTCGLNAALSAHEEKR